MKNDPVGWPSATVAIAVLGMITAITVSAIFAYDDVEDALKIWTALAAVVGLVTGSFVTYFFTRSSVEDARREKDMYRSAFTTLAGNMEPTLLNDMRRAFPEINRAFTSEWPPRVS